MPLSEFYRLAKGKHKSAQQQQEQSAAGADSSSPGPGPSSLHGGDFVELLWENGQVMMKGLPDTLASNSKACHNNTNNRSSVVDLPQTSRFKEKGVATGGNNAEMMDSLMNDFQISGPSELDLVPWLSYHSEDEHWKNNYSSDFFTEVSGVNAAECSNHMTGFTPVERPSNEALPFKDSHQISFQKNTTFKQRDVSSMRPNMSQLDWVCSFPSLRPKVSYNLTQNISCGESSQKRYISSVHSSKKMEAQGLGQPVISASFINFPHFAARVKSGLEGTNAKVNPEVPFTKKVDCKDNNSVLIGAKPASPSQIPAGLPISKSLEMLHHAGHSGIVSCQGISGMIDVSSKQVTVPNEKIASENVEITTEPVVVSSVCSRNSVDRASNHPTHDLKRRYNESEDSENLSEDFEEESVDIKKAANNRVSSGSKRSRAAEVHNLTERRRRDRSNEKMRALQELVPNCNKVDKASMIDEAIEYLKTLQLQVQTCVIMPFVDDAMGHGVCMPPMALPHMPRFTPMGFGMGYGLGMNMNSSNYPQIPQFPVSAFGALNINLPRFQGQGVAMPSVSSPACSPIKMALNLDNASSALPTGNLNSGQISHPKNMAFDITQERLITNQLVRSDELHQAAALPKEDHPSTSKATEPSTKS